MMRFPTPTDGERPAGAMPKRQVHNRLLGVFTVLITIAFGLIVAELGLRTAARYGWIQLWSKLRQARESSIWTSAADSRLIYQHRPDYVKNGTKQTERRAGIGDP